MEYSFTEKGRDLIPVFYEMMNWGFKYEADNEKIMQEQVENGKSKDPG